MFCPRCSKKIKRVKKHCSHCDLNIEGLSSFLSSTDENEFDFNVQSGNKLNQTAVNIGLSAVIAGVLCSVWLVALLPFTNPIVLVSIIAASFVSTLLCPAFILRKCLKIFSDVEVENLSDTRKSLNAGASMMLISTVISIIFAGTMGAKNKFFTWLGPAEEVLSFFLCFTTLILINSLFTTKIFNRLNRADTVEKEESEKKISAFNPQSLFADTTSPDMIGVSESYPIHQPDLISPILPQKKSS